MRLSFQEWLNPRPTVENIIHSNGGWQHEMCELWGESSGPIICTWADTTPWWNEILTNQTSLSETNQTKLSLEAFFVCFVFGARWQIGITNLPLSGNFVMGSYIRAIGSGFSDTICPLTTLGLVDFWLVVSHICLFSPLLDGLLRFNMENQPPSRSVLVPTLKWDTS